MEPSVSDEIREGKVGVPVRPDNEDRKAGTSSAREQAESRQKVPYDAAERGYKTLCSCGLPSLF